MNHQADLEDLNLTLIQQYLREVDSGLYRESGRREFAGLCRDMNLNSELPEYAKTTVDRAIKSLKEKNRIRREGATKNGKWIIIK